NGKNYFLEAVKVRVHDVQRHLHAGKEKLVLISHLQHVAVNLRTLVSGETNIANLSCFFRFDGGFHAAPGGEDSLGIVHTDHFVKLQQVDMISLKPAKRFVDLICGGLGIAAVDLRHQESLLPIAIAESLAHADLAFSAVVIPAIIEEVDAFVESRSDNADALVL